MIAQKCVDTRCTTTRVDRNPGFGVDDVQRVRTGSDQAGDICDQNVLDLCVGQVHAICPGVMRQCSCEDLAGCCRSRRHTVRRQNLHIRRCVSDKVAQKSVEESNVGCVRLSGSESGPQVDALNLNIRHHRCAGIRGRWSCPCVCHGQSRSGSPRLDRLVRRESQFEQLWTWPTNRRVVSECVFG